ncbi:MULTISPECIES: type III pantothenate kinase [Dyella]|uniref:Type III pantothenate kinase n=2 Tax=Dyella TaxID=231454 RepID=A0A4R0Z125_9GAMM|nr:MULTISPECIES: type III pantothenate kinase [Dyella]TBR40468.1 type III pantothenate kinase [Dyella terrae]TCI11950.1 type III pantothenate kinase [Dyella soli]
MRLLLDLGNTRLKWWLPGAVDAMNRDAISWDDDIATGLRAAWAPHDAPTEVWAASVVDAARERVVEEVLAARWGIAPNWVRTPADGCGVRNAYAEPHRLGIDRFLAMVAAHADGVGACVLVGVGTALTLDALTDDGHHLGGLIAPGPQLMQQSLLGATARVRPERPGRVVDAADNTADAVASGCWQAAAALVERFVAHMSPALGANAVVRIGGGDGESLKSLLALPVELVADGVLHGLDVWANAQSGVGRAS